MNNPNNIENKIYREKADALIKSRYIYPTINWNKSLIYNNDNYDQYLMIDCDIDYNIINNYVKILDSKPAIIYANVQIVNKDNYIPKVHSYH